MKLRQAEICDGKVCLNGEVIPELEFLGLGLISVSNSFSYRDLVGKAIEGSNKPPQADAYVKGAPITRVKECREDYPILYLNCHLERGEIGK